MKRKVLRMIIRARNKMEQTPKKLMEELALDAAITRGLIPHRKPQPGRTILNLPAEQREILQQLTSNDIENTFDRTAIILGN